MELTVHDTELLVSTANRHSFCGVFLFVGRCVGYYGEEDSPSRRLARPLVFCRTESDCPLENGYARPVEGIHVLVDMQKMEVNSLTHFFPNCFLHLLELFVTRHAT